MMRSSLLKLALLSVICWMGNGIAFAQNHLPNPSFETYTNCPTSLSQVDFAVPYDEPIGHLGSTDYYNSCNGGTTAGVPMNSLGNQLAAHGDGYIGFYLFWQNNYREYAQTPLTQPLIAGTTYQFSLFYTLGDQSQLGGNRLQFYFSNTPTTSIATTQNMGAYMPQCSLPPTTYIDDKVNWTRLSMTYTAAGGEEWLTMGNFFDNTNTQTIPVAGGQWATVYVYVDSMNLYPINPSGHAADTTLCPGACYQLWAIGDGPYQWATTTNPVPFSSADTVVVCPTATTSYIVYGQTDTDTVVVTVLPPPPTVDLGNDTSVCQGQSVTFDAGNPGLTFVWSPGGAVTQTLNANTSGTYQVIVSNTCGADTDAVQLTVVPNPTPNLGPDTSFCYGGNMTLNAGAGFVDYDWSTNATTQSINVNTSGTYSVTVTTALGCVGSDAINVGVALQMQLSMSHTNVTCNGGNNGTATVLASGSGPMTYVWSAPGSPVTPTISGLAAGTYTVTVHDAFGCESIGSTTVTQPVAMGITVTGSPESCPGRDDGSAVANASGGSLPYTYIWSNSGTAQTIFNLAPGTYFVTVTDAQGCTATGSVVINPGAAVFTGAAGTPSFCEGEGGDTLNANGSGGTGGPYYYQWWCAANIGPCGLDSLFDDDPIANPTVSGWYYVQVTDGAGCQSEVDSVFVTVLPKPVVNAGPDIHLCGLNAPCEILNPSISGTTGPFTYQWIPSAGLNNANIANPCARPDTTTIYALVVTAGNGCLSEFTTTDTLSTVVVNVNPVPVADAGVDRHSCLGDSVMLVGIGSNAGPAYGYEWSPSTGLGRPNSAVTNGAPPATTVYTLVVWSNNCPSVGDDVTLFVHTIPTVDAGPDREICLGDSILLDAQAGGDSTASYGFHWTPTTEINDPSVEDPWVWPIRTTTYHVEASSNYGCGSSFDSLLVTLLPTPIADAGDDAVICLGNSYTLQGSYHYTTTIPANPSNVFQLWTPALALDDPTLLQPIATPTISNWYHLTVRTGICSTQDSVLLTVIPEIQLTADVDTTVICSGDSVALSAASPVSGLAFNWTPSQGIADPHAASTNASPASSTTYTVVASRSGCADTTSVSIDVIPTPVASFMSSLTHGCAPLTVSFMENTNDAIAFAWQLGDGTPVVNESAVTHTYTLPGSYAVTLTATNMGGCEDATQVMTVVVSDTAAIDFHSDPSFPVELALPNTLVHFFNDAPSAMSYDWSFGDGVRSDEPNPTHMYTEKGTYNVSLTITNAEGCPSHVVKGPFIVSEPDLFIPNVFSPNADGVNDIFLVQYTGSQPFNLQVIDRWGVKVHAANNKTKGWDGKDMKGLDLLEGVYYYSLKIGNRDFTGNITLVR